MPRKTKLDASWRQPRMRKCEAPKEVGKAPRCGKPFPAIGVKKTCSPECSHKLWLKWRHGNYKRRASEILAQQKRERDKPDPARPRTLPRPCANRDCPYGENGQPKLFVNRKGALCCSGKCREAYRKTQNHQYYLDNPEKWQRSNVKRTERERAERIPTIRPCVVCRKKFVVKHPNTRSITCSLECRNIRARHIERVRYAADIKTSRAKANAKQHARYHAKKAVERLHAESMPRYYDPDLTVDLNSPFVRDAANKLVRRAYWMDMNDRTLVMVMTQGIGANLTNGEKRAHLIDLKREHLIDQVCTQEILPPER